MPYNPVPKKQQNTNFKKNEWLDLPLGTSQIRLLSESPVEINTHYVNKTYIKCLGDSCPVCERNRAIFKEFPDTYRDQKGYASRSTRYFANVLDKTSVKICPSCQKAHKKEGNKFPTACDGVTSSGKCNTMLVDVKAQPLNKVRIWGWGSEQQDRLAGFYASEVDEEGTPIPLTNYDFMLLVTPSGTKKIVTPSPRADLNDKVEVPEDQLFNLNNAVINLTAEEVLDFMKGISIRDLFNARKDAKDAKASKEFMGEEEDEDLKEKIENAGENIQKLFKN